MNEQSENPGEDHGVAPMDATPSSPAEPSAPAEPTATPDVTETASSTLATTTEDADVDEERGDQIDDRVLDTLDLNGARAERVAVYRDVLGRVIAAVGDSVLSLLGDRNARAAMSAAGQQLMDGHGALRVARAIAEEIPGGAGAEATPP